MKGLLMNLVLMGQVKTGKGGYSIPVIMASLTNNEGVWFQPMNRIYITLEEVVVVAGSKIDRWWLEGRSYT